MSCHGSAVYCVGRGGGTDVELLLGADVVALVLSDGECNGTPAKYALALVHHGRWGEGTHHLRPESAYLQV